MKKHGSLLIFSLLCNLSSISTFAQVPADSLRSANFFKNMDSVVTRIQKDSSSVAKDSTIEARLSDLAKDRVASIQAEYHYHKTYVDYLEFSLLHRKRMFTYQYYSKMAIFVLVALIVLSGLVFSALQFIQTLSVHKLSPRSEQSTIVTTPVESVGVLPQAASSSAQTQLELSLSGIKITSSIVGLLILIVSIAFFYLYVQMIYPLTEIQNAPEPKTSLDSLSTR